jgi:hypothetical protein
LFREEAMMTVDGLRAWATAVAPDNVWYGLIRDPILKLLDELDRLKAEAAERSDLTLFARCPYCEWSAAFLPGERAEWLAAAPAHAIACEKHPMRAVEVQLATEQLKIAAATTRLLTLTAKPGLTGNAALADVVRLLEGRP